MYCGIAPISLKNHNTQDIFVSKNCDEETGIEEYCLPAEVYPSFLIFSNDLALHKKFSIKDFFSKCEQIRRKLTLRLAPI